MRYSNYSDYMKMDLKNSIFFFLLTFVMSSCTGHRISRYLHSLDWEEGDTVLVDIRTIIKQPFDYYYYSGGLAFRSDISEEIGIEYKGCSIDDGILAVFFIRDKRLVYEERFSIRFLDDFRNIKWGEAVASPYVCFVKRGHSNLWWHQAKEPQLRVPVHEERHSDYRRPYPAQ